MKKTFTIAAALLFAAGCGSEVRYITARAWVAAPGGGAPAAAPAAPAPAATPAAEGAASAPAPSGGGIQSNYYLTYWEGKCGGFGGGCNKGTSKVKRCHVNADNSATCVDEADINKLLGAD
jgi:hypothetical protein